MSPLGLSNLTWGISGPDFLVGYGLLALVALLGIIVARWGLGSSSSGGGCGGGGGGGCGGGCGGGG